MLGHCGELSNPGADVASGASTVRPLKPGNEVKRGNLYREEHETLQS